MKMFSGLMPRSSGLRARRLQLLALAEIGGEGHHLAAVGGLQPLQDDRGVEPAGIGEHDLVHALLSHSVRVPECKGSGIGCLRLKSEALSVQRAFMGAACFLCIPDRNGADCHNPRGCGTPPGE